MKEWTKKQVKVKLDEVEEQAVEVVLNFLERMSYLYDEEDVESIFVEFDEYGNDSEIIIGTPERAIQALEEIIGVWK